MNSENSFKTISENKIFNLLTKYDNEIYLVGGAVRDILMGVNPEKIHDFDIIITDCPAKDFARKFADENEVASVVTLDEVNNIYRVVLADKVNYIDITNPVENSFEADIKRRDLTINAIAFDIRKMELLDLTGGIGDIKNRVIRAVCEENFRDDPLRILRAYRFASTLGFEIEKDTLSIIEKNKGMVLNPAVERRNCEIIKLFGGKYCDRVIKEMDKAGLVDILFPIMLDVKKVPSNSHHHLDLFNHSIETVKHIQELYETSRAEVKEHLDRVDFGGDTRLAHLKFAGFLHDIGKFSTWTIEPDGRHRFIRHDEMGSELAKGILREQKFSKKQIEYISFIIRHHIYPSSVVSSENVSDKVYMRYIRKSGENAIDLITVAKADRLSARGVMITDEMVKDNLERLDKLQEFYIKVLPTLKPIPKLLDGNEVMKILKIGASSVLGEILEGLKEAQIDNKVLTKSDAVEFVKEYYSEKIYK